LEVVKYLYNKGIEVTKSGINFVINNDHLGVLKYLYGKGLKANVDSIYYSIHNSNLTMLKFLSSKGVIGTKNSLEEVREWGITFASENGDLEISKFLEVKQKKMENFSCSIQ
jgi:hypothetical protein